jgi:hypothetical protein
MGERGERRSRGGDLEDLGVTKKQSHNWQKLAAYKRNCKQNLNSRIAITNKIN